jgi:hypothetical protein
MVVFAHKTCTKYTVPMMRCVSREMRSVGQIDFGYGAVIGAAVLFMLSTGEG